jgi:hypothetical protein
MSRVTGMPTRSPARRTSIGGPRGACGFACATPGAGAHHGDATRLGSTVAAARGCCGFRDLRLAMTGKVSTPERRRVPRATRIGGGSRAVYRKALPVSSPRSAHDRFRRRVSRTAPPPPALRPDEFSALRASPPREDAAAQDRLREPRVLARLSRPRRAARAGLCRGRTPRLHRVRYPLLWIRTRSLHGLPPGLCRGLLLQGTGRVSVLQGQAHGTDRGPPRRSRHPAGTRAAVGDLRAEAAATARPAALAAANPSRRLLSRAGRHSE